MTSHDTRTPTDIERESPRELLEKARKHAEEAKKLEQERLKECERLELPETAGWDEIVEKLSPPEPQTETSDENIDESAPSEDAQKLLEIPEGATMEEAVSILEENARSLADLKERTEVSYTSESDTTLFDDYKNWGLRNKQRMELLDRLLEDHQENPGLKMAQNVSDHDRFKRLIERISIEIPQLQELFSSIEENSSERHEEEILRTIMHNRPRYMDIIRVTALLETYIQPLLKSDDEGALPIRAYISTVQAINADMHSFLLSHGVEYDYVKLLSTTTVDDPRIERRKPEGFLYEDDVPLNEMRALVESKKTEPDDTVITDIDEVSYTINGKSPTAKSTKTKFIVYSEGNWQARMGRDSDNPEFTTHS